MSNFMTRRTKIAAAAVAVFAIAGCASLGLGGAFQQPVVSFKILRVRGLGLRGVSVSAAYPPHIQMETGLDATRLT